LLAGGGKPRPAGNSIGVLPSAISVPAKRPNPAAKAAEQPANKKKKIVIRPRPLTEQNEATPGEAEKAGKQESMDLVRSVCPAIFWSVRDFFANKFKKYSNRDLILVVILAPFSGMHLGNFHNNLSNLGMKNFLVFGFGFVKIFLR
jgi:hypothetical protein